MAGSGSIRWDVRRFDRLDSTNSEVKRAAKRGAPEGFAVTARRQTGGYGRQGRAWASPSGSLYVSLLLRPRLAAGPSASDARAVAGASAADARTPAGEEPGITLKELPSLSLVTGLAVRQAVLRTFPHLDPDLLRVKWPNDVLHGDAKLCGISLELVDGALCVGIGINVFAPTGEPSDRRLSDGAPGETLDDARCDARDDAHDAVRVGAFDDAPVEAEEAASIERAGKYRFAYAGDLDRAESGSAAPEGDAGAIDRLLEALLEAFGASYERWRREGFAPFAPEFTRVMARLDRRVRMETVDGGVRETGIIRGVDERGRLIMQVESESAAPTETEAAVSLRHVASGEVHFL